MSSAIQIQCLNLISHLRLQHLCFFKLKHKYLTKRCIMLIYSNLSLIGCITLKFSCLKIFGHFINTDFFNSSTTFQLEKKGNNVHLFRIFKNILQQICLFFLYIQTEKHHLIFYFHFYQKKSKLTNIMHYRKDKSTYFYS